MMKKLVALLLSLMLVCSAASALAAKVEFTSTSDLPKALEKVKDVPDYKSTEQVGNEYKVVFTSDPFANDFYTDDGNFGSADVYLYFEYDNEDGDSYTTQLYYGEEGTRRDGNTFYFEIPEGARVFWATVEFSQVAFDEYYTNRRDSDGWHNIGLDTVHGHYDVSLYDNGKVSHVSTYDWDDEGYCYYYFDETGALTSYEIPVDPGYSIQYSADGTAMWARYEDYSMTNEYHYYYWNSTDGWYVDHWDEETGEYVMMKVDAPDGVADPTSYKAPYAKVVRNSTWYGNNTVGVLGLSLRDDLGMTDKWYNVVPVDLTVEGTQTFPMVASNIFLFGSANVTVADGNVTVTYTMPRGHAYLKEECLQWFTSLDEITADFLANPVGKHTFGEPVSISDELNGQDVALLFICNHVTYRQPITDNGGMLTRYYNTQERWQNWRAALTELLDAMGSETADAATDTDVADAATDTDVEDAAADAEVEDAAADADAEDAATDAEVEDAVADADAEDAAADAEVEDTAADADAEDAAADAEVEDAAADADAEDVAADADAEDAAADADAEDAAK